MQLSEHHRQAYLDAMGIQVWFPRVELPHAIPARTLEGVVDPMLTEPSLREGTAPSVPDADDAPSTDSSPTTPVLGSADILNRMGLSAPESSSPAITPAKALEPQETVPDPAPSTISQFRLVVVPLGEHHLAVTEMPYTGLNQFSRYHLRLLQDIARALKLPSPGQQFREFAWPLSVGAAHGSLLSQVSQDDRAAADAVSAFLQNQFGLSRQHTILLFGQAAARFVIDPHKPFDTLRGVQAGLFDNQHVAVTYSLNELMKIPALKADAWTDLRPLLSKQPSTPSDS